MTEPSTIPWPPPERRIALLVLSGQPCAPLSPFYALAPYLGIADFRGVRHGALRTRRAGAVEITSRVLACRPRVLIAGFVPDDACQMLTAAGIDVRLGPCSMPASDVARRYQDLPRAAPAYELDLGTANAIHHL